MYKMCLMMKNLLCSLRNFYRNVRYIISWIPVLWNNYDWDYHYFLDVMKFKLETMHSFYVSDKVHCKGAEKVAADIKIAIDLINRISKNNYIDKMLADHVKKWMFEFRETNSDNPHALVFFCRRNNCNKEFRAIFEHGEKMIRQDVEYLFRHIAKNLMNWRD